MQHSFRILTLFLNNPLLSLPSTPPHSLTASLSTLKHKRKIIYINKKHSNTIREIIANYSSYLVKIPRFNGILSLAHDTTRTSNFEIATNLIHFYDNHNHITSKPLALLNKRLYLLPNSLLKAPFLKPPVNNFCILAYFTTSKLKKKKYTVLRQMHSSLKNKYIYQRSSRNLFVLSDNS
jgi:hypothetical protein